MLWKIEKVIKYGRYLRAVLPKHPNSSGRGYIALHRVLMENELGRLLKDNEVVHHINGNGQDNRIKNLMVMTVSEHMSLHRREKTKDSKWGKPVTYICDNCGESFSRPYRSRDEKTKHFCSNHCKASYAGKF